MQQHIAVWSLVLACCLCLVNGCSMPNGWHPQTDEEHVLSTQAFVYGRVERTFRTPGDRRTRTYTAEVRIYCTFKGPQMPQKVNFTRVGEVPGMCYSTELQRGRTYAILMDWIPDEGQALMPYLTLPADDAKIRQLARTCGLHSQYPQGLSEDTDQAWSCPAAAPSDQCLDQAYFDSQRSTRKTRGGGARGGGKNRISSTRLRRPQAPVARNQERSFWTDD